MSLDQLQQLLATVSEGVDDARAHTNRARELLEEFRHVIVEAQAQARPWLPPQLAHAFELLDSQPGRLAGVTDALERYAAQL